MTDKEKNEIGRMDVSKCRYFLKDTEGQDYNTDEFVKGCCEAKGSCIGYEFAKINNISEYEASELMCFGDFMVDISQYGGGLLLDEISLD